MLKRAELFYNAYILFSAHAYMLCNTYLQRAVSLDMFLKTHRCGYRSVCFHVSVWSHKYFKVGKRSGHHQVFSCIPFWLCFFLAFSWFSKIQMLPVRVRISKSVQFVWKSKIGRHNWLVWSLWPHHLFVITFNALMLCYLWRCFLDLCPQSSNQDQCHSYPGVSWWHGWWSEKTKCELVSAMTKTDTFLHVLKKDLHLWRCSAETCKTLFAVSAAPFVS